MTAGLAKEMVSQVLLSLTWCPVSHHRVNLSKDFGHHLGVLCQAEERPRQDGRSRLMACREFNNTTPMQDMVIRVCGSRDLCADMAKLGL